jgi:hypothetical protein
MPRAIQARRSARGVCLWWTWRIRRQRGRLHPFTNCWSHWEYWRPASGSCVEQHGVRRRHQQLRAQARIPHAHGRRTEELWSPAASGGDGSRAASSSREELAQACRGGWSERRRTGGSFAGSAGIRASTSETRGVASISTSTDYVREQTPRRRAP